MNRYIVISILLLVFRLTSFGQTAYWAENFASDQGWAMESNWGIENGKMQFFWAPVISNFDLSATSPLVTLDENTIELVVKQHLNVYIGTNNEFAEIILITEGQEIVLWDYPLAGGHWGLTEGSELVIPVAQYAGSDVKIKFRTHGLNTFNWNAWDVFEMHFMAHYDFDLAITGITGPASLNILEEGTWIAEVSNIGLQAVSGYTVNITDIRNSSTVATFQETVTIQPGQTKLHTFNWSPAMVHNTAISASVSTQNDMFNGNNTLGSVFLRVKPDMDVNVLVWNNDNGIPTILCPEEGDMIRPYVGLTRILQSAEIEYTLVTQLPSALEDFDVVFVILGCYCLS